MSIEGAKFPDKNGIMFGVGAKVLYNGDEYTVVGHTSSRIRVNTSNPYRSRLTTPNKLEVKDAI